MPARFPGIAQQWGQNGATAVSAAAHHQMQATDVYQQAAAVQPQAVVPQAVQADPVAPTVNPTTGAPDYSAQWAAYYRLVVIFWELEKTTFFKNKKLKNWYFFLVQKLRKNFLNFFSEILKNPQIYQQDFDFKN